MDFAFSEEQEMLRSGARDWLGDRFPPERVAELASSDEGWDASSWSEMAELGWLGLAVPEERGGSGMGFLEEAVLYEELGYGLYPGPYFATVALALPALSGNTDLVERIVAGRDAATLAWSEPGGPYLMGDLGAAGTKAAADGDSWALSGEKILVPDAAAAGIVVVAARSPEGLGLWAVERSDVTDLTTTGTMDATRRFGRVRFDATPAVMVAEPGRAEGVLAAVRGRALAALALEAVGVAQKALELAIAHAAERKQFDKPIGTYQAVSHSMANAYMDTELARSLAYWAAWCVAEGDPSEATAVPAAKSFAGEAAVAACERAIQVHGGIGFTWEHVLHRYYKRAQWIDGFEGFGRSHRATVAAALLDEQ